MGALRLTPAVNSARGAVEYILPQPASAGLEITFRFAMWGGNGADGLAMFLRKGSESSTAVGGIGGSLGYSTNWENSGNPAAGMAGGLLALGFDLWGNFAGDNSAYGGQSCPARTWAGSASGGLLPNSIAVRGPGSGTTNYCRIAGMQPSVGFNSGASTRAGRSRLARITVDPSTYASPNVTVFYSSDGTLGSLTQVLQVAAPAELLAEPTFKFGFTAGTVSGDAPRMCTSQQLLHHACVVCHRHHACVCC